MTREEIEEKYQKQHDELSERYYRGGNPDGLSPTEFRSRHDKIWIDLERELKAAGYIKEPQDYRALYQKAGTINEKVDILARRMGLIS